MNKVPIRDFIILSILLLLGIIFSLLGITGLEVLFIDTLNKTKHLNLSSMSAILRNL